MLRRILPKREYKSGSTWCLWRWTYTWAQNDYITRLHVLKTPWFAICLHWINGPDPEPHLHDHPVSFLSIILKGGYSEWRRKINYNCDRLTNRVHRYFNWIKASEDDRHRICHVEPGTVTLCFMGPKVREWGFHTEEGWIYWKDYNKRYK